MKEYHFYVQKQFEDYNFLQHVSTACRMQKKHPLPFSLGRLLNSCNILIKSIQVAATIWWAYTD
jgi:hypothetical protein